MSNIDVNPNVPSQIKLVISWRRDCPSASSVHRLYDRLADRYGKEAIFFDLENMKPGNFTDQISKAIAQASVLLVIVGRDWAGKDGKLDRILDPEDFVFQEVQAAHTYYKDSKTNNPRRMTLICVSVDGGIVPKTPSTKSIPCLKHLIYNNALPLASNRELSGINTILEHLDEYIPRPTPPEDPPPAPTLHAPADPVRERPSFNNGIVLACVGAILIVALSAVLFLFPFGGDDREVPSVGDDNTETLEKSIAGPDDGAELVPANVRVFGTILEIELPGGRILSGGLGQETQFKDGYFLSRHPGSGFALLNATPADLESLVVVVEQSDSKFVAKPSAYGSGYAYVPDRASQESPAIIRIFQKQ